MCQDVFFECSLNLFFLILCIYINIFKLKDMKHLSDILLSRVAETCWFFWGKTAAFPKCPWPSVGKIWQSNLTILHPWFEDKPVRKCLLTKAFVSPKPAVVHCRLAAQHYSRFELPLPAVLHNLWSQRKDRPQQKKWWRPWPYQCLSAHGPTGQNRPSFQKPKNLQKDWNHHQTPRKQLFKKDGWLLCWSVKESKKSFHDHWWSSGLEEKRASGWPRKLYSSKSFQRCSTLFPPLCPTYDKHLLFMFPSTKLVFWCFLKQLSYRV